MNQQRKRGKTTPTTTSSSSNVDTTTPHANTLRPKKRKERAPAHLKPLARTHSTPDGIVPDRGRNGEEDTTHLEVKVDKVCTVVIYGVSAGVNMYSNLSLIFKFATLKNVDASHFESAEPLGILFSTMREGFDKMKDSDSIRLKPPSASQSYSSLYLSLKNLFLMQLISDFLHLNIREELEQEMHKRDSTIFFSQMKDGFHKMRSEEVCCLLRFAFFIS